MADVGNDLGDRAVVDVVVDVGPIDLFAEFRAQGLCLGAVALTLDAVLDLAQDAPAGAFLADQGGWRPCRLGEFPGESDGAADGAGDALERDGGVFRGVADGGRVGLGILLRGIGLLADQAGRLPLIRHRTRRFASACV